MATVLTAVNVSVANQEEALLVSKETREQHLSRTEVLGRVGRVLTALPGADIATTRQVAEFYGVDVDAIESVVKRNSDELILNGMTKIKGKEIKELVSVNMTETKAQVVNKQGYFKIIQKDNEIKIGYSFNTVFTRRAILNVGMLLRDSTVAQTLRSHLLNIEEITSTKTKAKMINMEAQAVQNGEVFDRQEMIDIIKNELKAEIMSELEVELKKEIEALREEKQIANFSKQPWLGVKPYTMRGNISFAISVRSENDPAKTQDLWSSLYSLYEKHAGYSLNTALREHNRGLSKPTSKIQYLTDTKGLNLLYKLAYELFEMETLDLDNN